MEQVDLGQDVPAQSFACGAKPKSYNSNVEYPEVKKVAHTDSSGKSWRISISPVCAGQVNKRANVLLVVFIRASSCCFCACAYLFSLGIRCWKHGAVCTLPVSVSYLTFQLIVIALSFPEYLCFWSTKKDVYQSESLLVPNISSPFISFPVPFFISSVLLSYLVKSKQFVLFFFYLKENKVWNATKLLNGVLEQWMYPLSATDCCSYSPQSCILDMVFVITPARN